MLQRRLPLITEANPLGLTAPHATERLWRRVHREDARREQGCRCTYCSDPITARAATADHVTARHNGGQTSRDNIKAACGPCNSLKGHQTEKRFRRLIKHPPGDASLTLRLAHFRLKLWSRVALAERRILALVGLEP